MKLVKIYLDFSYIRASYKSSSYFTVNHNLTDIVVFSDIFQAIRYYNTAVLLYYTFCCVTTFFINNTALLPSNIAIQRSTIVIVRPRFVNKYPFSVLCSSCLFGRIFCMFESSLYHLYLLTVFFLFKYARGFVALCFVVGILSAASPV